MRCSYITYYIARNLLSLGLHAFFSKITIEGEEHIPVTGGALIVANHSNAFIDALLAMKLAKRPVRLVAKAALTKSPFLSILLGALGSEVVHRKSDDASSQARDSNLETLERLSERLQQGELVCLFPEGKSHSEPSMLPFKSGAARVILSAWQNQPAIPLVPCAFFYSAKDNFRSEIVVRVLSPLQARDFEQASARGVTKAVEARIAEELPQFQSADEQEIACWLARLLAKRGTATRPLEHMDEAAQDQYGLLLRMSQALRVLSNGDCADRGELISHIAKARESLTSSGFNLDEIYLSTSRLRAIVFLVRELELLLLALPLSALGILINVIPFKLTARLVFNTARELDQVATNAVFLGVPIFLIWYLILLGSAFLFFSWPWAIFASLLGVYSSVLALHMRDRFVRAIHRSRAFLALVVNPQLNSVVREEMDALRAYVVEIERKLCQPTL